VNEGRTARGAAGRRQRRDGAPCSGGRQQPAGVNGRARAREGREENEFHSDAFFAVRRWLCGLGKKNPGVVDSRRGTVGSRVRVYPADCTSTVNLDTLPAAAVATYR